MHCKPKWKIHNYKLLEGNIGENLNVLGCSKGLNIKLKSCSVKEIIDILDFIKIKNLGSVKDLVKRVRRHKLGENICIRHIWIKDRYPKYARNS